MKRSLRNAKATDFEPEPVELKRELRKYDVTNYYEVDLAKSGRSGCKRYL